MECDKCGCESVEIKHVEIDGQTHSYGQCECCGKRQEQEKFVVEFTKEEMTALSRALFEAKVHEADWMDTIDELTEDGTLEEDVAKGMKQTKAGKAADYDMLERKISTIMWPFIWGDLETKNVYEYPRDCEYFKNSS